MLYKPSASGEVKHRTDNKIYRLYSISFHKDNQRYTLVPEISLLFKNNDFKEIDIHSSQYWTIMDNLKEKKLNLIKEPYNAVAIVTTGKCLGQCTYCYAKDAWKLEQYLTPEIFDETCKLNRITEIRHSIIYGGEPLLNMQKFRTLFDHLIAKWNVPINRICTGLFFDEEIFQDVLKLTQDYRGRIKLFVSIDPKGDGYLRKYTKDTYSFLIDRICRLTEVCEVSLRTTLNKTSGSPFDLINEIEFKTGKRLQTCIELMTTGKEKHFIDKDYLEKLKIDIANHVSNVEPNSINIPDPVFKTYKNQNIYDSMKHCTLGSKTLAVLPDGGTTACSNEVYLGANQVFDKSISYKNIFELNKDPCLKCDYKMSCGKMCHDTINSKDFAHSQPIFCDYHIFCMIQGIELLVKYNTHEYIQNVCKNSQSLLNITFE